MVNPPVAKEAGIVIENWNNTNAFDDFVTSLAISSAGMI